MRLNVSHVAGGIAVSLATVLLAGCSSHSQSTSPTGSSSMIASTAELEATSGAPMSAALGGREIVDLRVGRLTRLDFNYRFQHLGPDGALVEELRWHSIIERRVIGTTVIDGRTYVLQAETYQRDGEEPESIATRPWRQDRSGLYYYLPPSTRTAAPTLAFGDADQPGLAADLASIWRASASLSTEARAILARQLGTLSLARPSGGALADEYTLLRYPLHPGQTWDGYPNSHFTVESVGNVALPIGRTRAARIDVELPDFFDGDDFATTWWGAPGEVKATDHLTHESDGPGGVHRYIQDSESVLKEYVPGTGELP